MADIAPRDADRTTCLLGTSSADGVSPVTLWADPLTHRLLTSPAGGSAPTDATYVTLTANATLTNERLLTGTANQITITDNGAGSTVVLSLPQSIATSSAVTFGGVTSSGVIRPSATDSAALGDTTHQFSDLFLAEGGVINWDNGDMTITQAGDTLTVAGGDVTMANLIVNNSVYSITGASLTFGAGDALANDTGNAVVMQASNADQTSVSNLNGGSVYLQAGLKRNSGTNGRIRMRVGASGNEAIFSLDSLSASRTLTIPDATGTIVLSDSPSLTSSVAATGAALLTNTADAASVQAIRLSGDRATMADNDEVYASFYLSDDGGTQVEFARVTAVATDVNVGTTLDGRMDFSINNAGTLTKMMRMDRIALAPSTANALTLGTQALPWGTLELGSAGQINWNSNDVQITHSANKLTFEGASSGFQFDSFVGPSVSDVAALGSASLQWSDLFLAEGAVINFDNGDVTLTQAGNTLTLAGGDLVLAENTSVALDPSLSGDGTWTGTTITATAGYTQAFGDLVYLDPTDSRWEAVDANAAAGADGDARGLLGMVVVAGTDGNACTILLNGVIRADANFPSFTINNPIYASETAGDVTQTQPTTTDVVIRIVGAALTADSMYFNPDHSWITHT